MNIPPFPRPTRALSAAVASAVIGTLTLLVAIPAQAVTDAERAETLIRDGVRLRGQDQTAKALPLFEEAYQLSRTPRAAAQLGLCELELGHFVQSETHLAEALASPEHPWIAKNKVVLKRQLEAARAGIGELVVTVSPEGADVALNGSPIDRSSIGVPIRLDRGQVAVEVRAPGFEPARESITITGGKRERRAFALVARPATAGSSPLVAGASGGATTGGPGASPANPEPSTSAGSASSGQRLAAWITGGAAIGALALGTAEAFNAASKRDDFNNHTGTMGGVAFQDCGTANLSGACKPLKDSYDQAVTLSVVGFAAAGALAVTSAVLFVLSSPEHQRGAEVGGSGGTSGRAWACVPQPGLKGVGCALRF